MTLKAGTKRFFCGGLVAFSALSAGTAFADMPADAGPATLAIQIQGVQRGGDSAAGTLNVGLFRAEDPFPEEGKAWKGMKEAVTGAGRITVVFTDLPPGRYAIALFQDMDSNGKLDRNFFGAPVEPVGFSRNPDASWGAPDFEQAVFDVTNGNNELKITLKKP